MSKLSKQDLVDRIAEREGLSKSSVDNVLRETFDMITVCLQDGESATIPGFGTFSTSDRAARKGRNPQTGEEIMIKANRVAKFKAAKALKDAVSTRER